MQCAGGTRAAPLLRGGKGGLGGRRRRDRKRRAAVACASGRPSAAGCAQQSPRHPSGAPLLLAGACACLLLAPCGDAEAVVKRSLRGGGAPTDMYSLDSRAAAEANLQDVPQSLGAGDDTAPYRMERPISREAEGCTRKCVTTCTRGSASSFNVRGAPAGVVFKPGFHERVYCLSECSQVCNLIATQKAGGRPGS